MAQVHYASLGSRSTLAEVGRWSLAGRIDWREWDGEFVVRVEDTASTYLLSTLAGETLKALCCGASYLDDIAARVFSDCASASAATAALVAAFAQTSTDTQALLAVLAEFEALGLARAELS